jgi:transposase
MTANRINLIDISQLIRLKVKGKSNRKIALLLYISRNTGNQYVSLLSATEHSWPALLEMDDARLLALLPKASTMDGQLSEQLLNYFPTYLKELSKPGCTLLNLWQEYISKHTNGYKYAQFVHYFRQWQDRKQVSGKLEHKAAEKVYVDFTGKKLSLIDRHSGEVKTVEVFVAILPASHYTFVTAVNSQSREDFI